MIISELIEELHHFLADCGDIEVLIGDSYDVRFLTIDYLAGSFYHHEDTKAADLYAHTSDAQTGAKSCRYGDECDVDDAPMAALIWTE